MDNNFGLRVGIYTQECDKKTEQKNDNAKWKDFFIFGNFFILYLQYGTPKEAAAANMHDGLAVLGIFIVVNTFFNIWLFHISDFPLIWRIGYDIPLWHYKSIAPERCWLFVHPKEGEEHPEFKKMMAAVDKVRRKCQVRADFLLIFSCPVACSVLPQNKDPYSKTIS